MIDHLIIDGRNNLYRLVFACLRRGNTEFTESAIRSVISYILRFNPRQVHLAWDYAGKNWRNAIYAPYKGNRTSQRAQCVEKYGVDAADIVNTVTEHMQEGMGLLGIRQYVYKYQEADDLMYSLCHVLEGDIVVVSSDKDMTQLLQQFDNIKVLNQLKDEFEQKPQQDIIKMKCLQGDSSDNISGFKNIGPARARAMTEDSEKLRGFLDEGDGSRRKYYELYERLIDLSKNPFHNYNINYVKSCLSKEVNTYKSAQFQNYLRKHKLGKLLTELRKFKMACSGLN